MGWIYLIRNKVNGKCYVGQTRQKKIESRWAVHSRPVEQNTSYIANSIRHHGWGLFEPSIICQIPNEELNAREILEIKERNTIAPNGYNLKLGGDNHETHPLVRARISASNTGKKQSPETIAKRNILNTGKKRTLEMCVRIAEGRKSNRKHTEETITKLKGRKHTEEEKLRMKGHHTKKVDQYSKDGTFLKTYNSITEAVKSLNLKSNSPITKCCNGVQKTGYKFIWKYNDPETYVINQYDLTGKFIKSFENTQTAADGTGGMPRNIGRCCNGKSNTSNGFIWKREVKN
jgi:group I intron endonuclease